MGLFSPNPAKQKKIELQNILFDTNEKKLMCSNEFLNDMTTNYVSKRMKNINKMTSGIVTTKNPNNFYSYCETIDHDLEELIRIEKYHSFKDPIPSEFKKLLEAKMGQYTEAMIKRTWRDISQKIGLDSEGKRDPRYYGPVLDALLAHKEKYTPLQFELVDKFYKSVYGISYAEAQEQALKEAEEAAAAEAAAKAAAEAAEALPEGEEAVSDTAAGSEGAVEEAAEADPIDIVEEAVE